MTYGEYRRTTPRLNILRGWAGNEPQSLTHSAKPKKDEAIKSGMAIVLDTNGEWVKATASNGEDKIPYFAYSDQSDTDVLSSGLLLGLSCLGDFEIQTPFFDTTPDTPWAHGDPVVLGATAGTLDKGASNLAAIHIVGHVTRGGMEDIVKINSEALPDVTGKVLVLNLVTRWRPATV